MNTRTVVMDIDGVLCDCSRELDAFIKSDPPKEAWNEHWFPSLGDYPCHEGWGILNRLLALSCDVVLLTNRPERIRPLTEEWLDKWNIIHSELIMRPEGAMYADGKRQRIVELLVTRHIVLAVDDDETQVALFREFGVPVIHAYNGLETMHGIGEN